MSKSTAKADVWRGDERVGAITRTPQGSVFAYDEAFLAQLPELEGGIAVHLPYQARTIETQGVNLHPFFAGLLPEGLRLTALRGHMKTSADDLLSLLLAVGDDTIGDVSVLPAGRAPTPRSLTDAGRLEDLDFGDLLRQSLGRKGIYDQSLPGVQEKLSAEVISFPVRSRSAGGSYILKLNPPGRPCLVENEAFFLRLAASCGIRVNSARLVVDKKGEPGLLVERFDRIHHTRNEMPEKVHQEDGCQLLNRYPADKYSLSVRDLIEGIRDTADAAPVQVLRFLEIVAFSYLIGNGDLHAKNVSLYRNPKTHLWELTPAYDLLTTLAYPELDQSMALAMDGRATKLKMSGFLAFGERFGVRPSALEPRLLNLVARIGEGLAGISGVGWEKKTEARVGGEIRRRMERF